jgi:hypothetical protein
MDNNFSPYMLPDQSLRAGTVTLPIAIGLPWYRALSTVRVALPRRSRRSRGGGPGHESVDCLVRSLWHELLPIDARAGLYGTDLALLGFDGGQHSVGQALRANTGR